MSKKILCWLKRPGEKARHVWISNSLENLQKTVGGQIEYVGIGSDFGILCNEDGKLKGLPFNVKVLGVDFVGTVILVGTKDGEFIDCPVDNKGMKILLPEWVK